MRSRESIHVECADKVLATIPIIPLSALLAKNGFINGVVVFQVDCGTIVADFHCRRCLDRLCIGSRHRCAGFS